MRKSLALSVSLLGLFDSAYLWWVYASPSRPMVCLGTGCDVVRASPFASLWGLPLPLYGVAMYAVLALLIFAEPLVAARHAPPLRYAVAGISGVGFLTSLYLTGVEAFVLHAWCAWCVVSALAVTLIFAVAVLEVIRPAPPPEPAAALAAVRTYFMLFVGTLAAGVPAFVLLARSGTLPPISSQQASPEVLRERLVRGDSHVTGNPQAPVVVVEFGDFQCPNCRSAEPTAREIRRKYGSQIRFAFRHFPLAQIHAWAEKAAEASECAAEQGKFWEAVENFYDHQNDLSPPALQRYAAEIALDQSRFSQCVSSGSMAARVRRDMQDGEALGVTGTPTFLIGQQMIRGTLEFGQFARLIEHEIATHEVTVAHSGPLTGGPPDPNRPSANPLKRTQQTAGDAPGAAPGALVSTGNGIFSQFHASATACSEDEARQQQPDLIGTPEARQYFEGGPKALFVDVRSPKEFERGRVPGAISLPAAEIERRLHLLPKNRIIVLYESGRSSGDICASSRGAGRFLLAHGFTREQVKVYQDGLAGWERAKLPVMH